MLKEGVYMVLRDVDWTDMEAFISLLLFAGDYRSNSEDLCGRLKLGVFFCCHAAEKI